MTSDRTGPRVLLADDYPGMLTAVRRTLQGACEVVGEVRSGSHVIEAARTLRPDVVVLDVSIPEVNGLELCRQVRSTMPETKVVLLTAIDDDDIAAEGLQLGASAIVLKNWMARDLLPSVRRAAVTDPATRG